MKTVIFDFDGTLANTLPICFAAFQSVFREFDNRVLSFDEIRTMFGPSETGIIMENLKNRDKKNAIELYYQKYLEHHEQLVASNNEIIDLLRFLKGKNIKSGIVTGKARRSLDISLKALQMGHFFDVTITGDDVISPKPHPEGIVEVLSLLGSDNYDSMFIGDSDADIEAGKRANITSVGARWLPDYQPKEFSIRPHYIFDNVTDFKNTLGELSRDKK